MKTEFFILSKTTRIMLPEATSTPVKKAIEIFARDFAKVFNNQPDFTRDKENASFRLELDKKKLIEPESYAIDFYHETDRIIMNLRGFDELGLIYGLYYISEHFLGVDPFWFWTDRKPRQQAEIKISAKNICSRPQRVRYRGWFVNDEVCLIGWTEDYPPPRKIWEPVFETLLRLGGNLVIPGTDLPRKGVHTKVAAEMGLYLTHHHAEPLGAEMFFRAHPDQEASFDKNASLFTKLWKEAIKTQKDRKIVWTLGFRGQGDCPFWEQDPTYDTPQKRGELISRAIQCQYDLLQEQVPGAPCVSYIYGELAELYRDGHIHFPPDVTKIWSDNGYGRMVSRRQDNDNPRIPSLPTEKDEGPHGLYYHATFHDLQASSHLTMLPVHPALIINELSKAFRAGTDHVLLANCGNIRPHIFTLSLIAKLWQSGKAEPDSALSDFTRTYFPSASDGVKSLLIRFIEAVIPYGPNDDDRAGDEFYHHPARSLVGHLMRGEFGAAEDLLWATGPVPLREQARWFETHCKPAAERFATLEVECETLAATLEPDEGQLLKDFLLFQIQFHRTGAEGLGFLSQSIAAFLDKAYPQAFVLASQAHWAYQQSLDAMQACEHGKWKHFFRADWLTNVASTLYSVQALRMYFRMFGDNPDYFLWHKEFLMPESEKKIYLENTHRNPPSDDKLARNLKVFFKL